MGKLSRKQLIAAVKKAAKEVDGSLRMKDFATITGISEPQIYALFPGGGWIEVKREAGLQRSPNSPVSDDELLRQFHRVATAARRIPSWTIFQARAPVSTTVVYRRFGGMQGTLEKYRDWLKANHPNSPFLQQVQEKLKQIDRSAPQEKSTPQHRNLGQWKRLTRPTLGAPLNFRGLHRAPTNEQGVVVLFTLVMHDLNITIEKVRSGFPDCEANRLVDQKDNLWQRVRIEFEYCSRSFLEHKHDPAECDMVVCWKHNWPECPLEVLELKSVIEDLKG